MRGCRPRRTGSEAKLAGLKIEIGSPRRDLDFTVQPTGRASFGSNMLIASTWHRREEMRRIGRGNADRRWDVLPQQPALAYDIAQNRLIVSAAVLQPPVLDVAQDTASQYGTFGALVAQNWRAASITSGVRSMLPGSCTPGGRPTTGQRSHRPTGWSRNTTAPIRACR